MKRYATRVIQVGPVFIAQAGELDTVFLWMGEQVNHWAGIDKDGDLKYRLENVEKYCQCNTQEEAQQRIDKFKQRDAIRLSLRD